MTTRSINALRQAFRKNIRKSQLQERFQHERILLMDVNPADAVRNIEGLLEKLQASLRKGNMKEVARVMTHMRSIAGQFMVLNFLMRKVSIPVLQGTTKSSKLCDSVSWIEVFIELLNQQDEAVREESSALLSLSLFQLRIANCEKYQLKKLIIIQKFPIKFLSDANWKVTMHMLAAFQELLEMVEFQKQVIYLIKNQHFLMVFVSLLEDEDRMQITPYQEKVVEASLLLIYFISRSERINKRPEIQMIHDMVKQLLMLRLKKGEDSAQLFAMLRVLSISQVKFSYQELIFIQSLLTTELARQNFAYFQTLNALIYQHDHLLSAYSFEAVTFELFRCNERNDPNSECLRKWLALIFYKTLQLIQQLTENQDYLHTIGRLIKSDFFIENSSLIFDDTRQSNEPLFIALIQSLRTICQLLDYSEQAMRIMALLQRYEESNFLEIP